MGFKPVFHSFLLFFLIAGAYLYAQDYRTAGSTVSYGGNQAIENGIKLYEDGKWGEAIVQLRRAKQNTFDNPTRAEAQFWIAISELSAGLYYDAIHDFDEIERIDPTSLRRLESPYHKGRALYYLEKYIDAIPLFTNYADSLRIDGRYTKDGRFDSWDSNKWNSENLYNDPNGDYNRKASAIYWIGECYYSLGDLLKAEETFNIIVNFYQKSYKYEVSTNRLAQIRQKKVEAELLSLLKSGNAAVQNNAQTPGAGAADGDTFNYDAAILAYKNRIAPYILEKSTAEGNQNMGNNKPNNNKPIDNQSIYNKPSEVSENESNNLKQNIEIQNNNTKKNDSIERLLSIKATALEMMDRLISTLNSYEVIEVERR